MHPAPAATRIRRASPADAAALSAFAVRTFHDTFAADNRPEDMAEYAASAFTPERQLAELRDPAAVVLLAEAGGSLAGYAQLQGGTAPPEVAGTVPLELARFYVGREWHGRGVAQALMREVLAVARERGAATLWLGVWDRNARAIAFYRKLGFRDVGAHVFQLGADAQTDRLMSLDLRAHAAATPAE